jgi:hypothetical protein
MGFSSGDPAFLMEAFKPLNARNTRDGRARWVFCRDKCPVDTPAIGHKKFDIIDSLVDWRGNFAQFLTLTPGRVRRRNGQDPGKWDEVIPFYSDDWSPSSDTGGHHHPTNATPIASSKFLR